MWSFVLVISAKAMGCNNAEHPDKYGHYREAKFTMTKHHWWWKVRPEKKTSIFYPTVNRLFSARIWFVCMCIQSSNWNLESVFVEEGKHENPEKNPWTCKTELVYDTESRD
jgi:hypothetical protein